MMRNLTILAWAMTATGLAGSVLALVLNLEAVWLLAGILLVVTGVVKIVMLMIWIRIARLGTDDHEPISAL